LVDWYYKKFALTCFSQIRFAIKLESLESQPCTTEQFSYRSFHKKNLKLCINILADNGYSLEVTSNEINKLKKLFVHKNKFMYRSISADNIEM